MRSHGRRAAGRPREPHRAEAGTNPVFVDDSGRRLRRVRAAAWSSGSTLVLFAGVVVAVLGITALGTPADWRAPASGRTTALLPHPTPTGEVPGPFITLPQLTAVPPSTTGAGRTAGSLTPATSSTKTSPTKSSPTKTAKPTATPTPTATATSKPKPTHTKTAPGQVGNKPTAPPGLSKTT